jgi:hypothetical protein
MGAAIRCPGSKTPAKNASATQCFYACLFSTWLWLTKKMILTFVHNQPAPLAGGNWRNEPWTQITLRRINGWRKIAPVVSLHTAVAA